MSFSLLVSTNKIDSIDLKKYKFNTLIINQSDNNHSIQSDHLQVFTYNERGLSKSRNRAVQNCTSKYALIADDDVDYVDNLEEIVIKSFKDNQCDVIIFNLKMGNSKLIYGSNKEFFHNKLSILSVCSCQIAFNVDSIKKNNIQFDERFGLNAEFISGEENLFLKSCIESGLKVKNIPICVGTHYEEGTTGNRWSIQLAVSKGALFYKMYGFTSYLFLLYFLIFKYSEYKGSMSILEFMCSYLKGISLYKESKAINNKKEPRKSDGECNE